MYGIQWYKSKNFNNNNQEKKNVKKPNDRDSVKTRENNFSTTFKQEMQIEVSI